MLILESASGTGMRRVLMNHVNSNIKLILLIYIMYLYLIVRCYLKIVLYHVSRVSKILYQVKFYDISPARDSHSLCRYLIQMSLQSKHQEWQLKRESHIREKHGWLSRGIDAVKIQ